MTYKEAKAVVDLLTKRQVAIGTAQILELAEAFEAEITRISVLVADEYVASWLEQTSTQPLEEEFVDDEYERPEGL